MALTTPLFTQHSRAWRSNRYVYPVISRRSKGLSIGVNLNPDKACNFDCVYCSVDRTVPGGPRAIDLAVLRVELRHMLAEAASGRLFADGMFAGAPPALRRINDIAFSGDGEPTAAREFPQAVRVAAEALAEAEAGEGGAALRATRLVVITNATLLGRPEVEAALRFLDDHRGQVWAKLDAGTGDYFHRIERTAVPFARVLANIAVCAQRRPLVIQALFLRDAQGPPSPAEIAAWLGRLEAVRAAGGSISLVQVYTIARATAVPGLEPLSPHEIDAIVEGTRATGFTAEGYYGPG